MDRAPKALSQIFVPLVFMMTKWTGTVPLFYREELASSWPGPGPRPSNPGHGLPLLSGEALWWSVDPHPLPWGWSLTTAWGPIQREVWALVLDV